MAQIKSKILYGGAKEIAEKSGFSTVTVSRVINGKSKNKKVKTAILAYLKEAKATDTEIANTISTL